MSEFHKEYSNGRFKLDVTVYQDSPEVRFKSESNVGSAYLTFAQAQDVAYSILEATVPGFKRPEPPYIAKFVPGDLIYSNDANRTARVKEVMQQNYALEFSDTIWVETAGIKLVDNTYRKVWQS